MDKKTKILIAILIALILIAGGLFWKASLDNIKIITEKKEYSIKENLKVKIKNNLPQNICFSSCYPYYLEKQRDQQWQKYSYVDCSKQDLIEKCIAPKEEKTFEIDLSFIESGLHRIALPVCLGCQLGQEYKESQRFYSNEFLVK